MYQQQFLIDNDAQMSRLAQSLRLPFFGDRTFSAASSISLYRQSGRGCRTQQTAMPAKASIIKRLNAFVSSPETSSLYPQVQPVFIIAANDCRPAPSQALGDLNRHRHPSIAVPSSGLQNRRLMLLGCVPQQVVMLQLNCIRCGSSLVV